MIERVVSRAHGTALSSSSPSPAPSHCATGRSMVRIYQVIHILGPHRNSSQSAPRAIIQILITGTQIFGKALYAAGTQAVKSILYLTVYATR